MVVKRLPIDHRVRAIVAHPDDGTHLRPEAMFVRFDERPILWPKGFASEQEPLGRVAAFRVLEYELLGGGLIDAQTNRRPIDIPAEGQDPPLEGGKVIPRALEVLGWTQALFPHDGLHCGSKP
jgi:hypothetical protein